MRQGEVGRDQEGGGRQGEEMGRERYRERGREREKRDWDREGGWEEGKRRPSYFTLVSV